MAAIADLRPRPRVVIADDSEHLRELLAYKLTAKGYFVQCADDGESGWDSLSAAPFDLMITDHEMPGLTGLNLLRRMRAASFCMPVILMSGNLPMETPELEKLLSPGAALPKPFSLVNLLSLIEGLLDRTSDGNRGAFPPRPIRR